MSHSSQPEQVPPAGPEAQVQGLSAMAARSLGAALAQRRMYPPEHPIAARALQSLILYLERILALVPEWRLALEWYRGYSPNGQFLDQRLRYRPRAYVLPSLSANF